MGKTSTASKAKYNAKNYDRLAITVRKGQREKIKAYAERNGESINSYINRLIIEDMEKHCK
jgi:hypothetical protein